MITWALKQAIAMCVYCQISYVYVYVEQEGTYFNMLGPGPPSGDLSPLMTLIDVFDSPSLSLSFVEERLFQYVRSVLHL